MYILFFKVDSSKLLDIFVMLCYNNVRGMGDHPFK